MDLASALGVASVFVLVLANGFFVATEFAIVGVRRSRLDHLATVGVANARAAQQVVGHLDTYIAACQLGITMASLALGWVGEPALAHLIEPPLEALVGRFAPTAAHGVAIGISFAIITSLHIVIGELAPKGLALQRPEGTALSVARPMQLFEFLFRWPIALLNGVGNGVLRIFGLHPAAGHELVHSVDELRLLVTGSQEAGVVEESEARIARRAFTFADQTAGALMTPRTEVDAVSVDVSLPELRARVAASAHTRLPVYRDSLDHIVGVLHVTDFYKALDKARETGAPFDLRPLLRGTTAVPASKPADDLLDEMRAAARYFAVVVDEYGGTAGIVTVDDLVEALVGRMPPETTPGDVRATPQVVQEADGSLLMDGLLRLEEWEEATGVQVEPADHEAAETLGGLIMARLGRIPRAGDEVTVADHTLRVEALDGRRVALVRQLSLAPDPQARLNGAPAQRAESTLPPPSDERPLRRGASPRQSRQ